MWVRSDVVDEKSKKSFISKPLFIRAASLISLLPSFPIQKTLNPVFDECFEFGTIALEQCLQESAMIAFTVMDHDVITANDFAGEAFLSLNNIPGVAELNMSVENFHGLKAIDLVLMQQRDKRELISTPPWNF